jgi:hypothetical protein
MPKAKEVLLSDLVAHRGVDRWRAVRVIASGAIRGGKKYGRWVIDGRDAEKLVQLTASRAAQPEPELTAIA